MSVKTQYSKIPPPPKKKKKKAQTPNQMSVQWFLVANPVLILGVIYIKKENQNLLSLIISVHCALSNCKNEEVWF